MSLRSLSPRETEVDKEEDYPPSTGGQKEPKGTRGQPTMPRLEVATPATTHIVLATAFHVIGKNMKVGHPQKQGTC